MNRPLEALPLTFTGADDNKLVADQYGAAGAPVLLLHGGGQTRHAWQGTAAQISRAGHVAVAMDQRGHGDSAWVENGAYSFDDFAADATSVADVLAQRHGERPVAIGASLGGIAVLLAQGNAARAGREPPFAALILVDITPRVDPNGLKKIHDFMRSHAHEGFATIEDAADAVAQYLPHRPRPRSLDGLKKNLRPTPEGRWRWHWDPRFLGERQPGSIGRDELEARMTEAARTLTCPVLLVRGSASELVQEEHVREFAALVPQAQYADVAGARHMVAGDRNDAFSTTILSFLAALDHSRA
ncbi:MAG: alpha/beta fold hydrolase [Pseudolabrys sp.]